MRKIAAALDAMSEMTKTTGVTLQPYGNAQIGIEDNVLAFAWDKDTQTYLIDDRIGD
jgi:hypothetical protein